MSERLTLSPIVEQAAETVDDIYLEHPQLLERPNSLITPAMAREFVPLGEIAEQTAEESRRLSAEIILGENDKLIAIVGPCSIHDPEAALEYANFVAELRNQYGEDLEIIMRTYFEKPRTTKGWKGFNYDPYLDGSDNINVGLISARILADRIGSMRVPIATERLDPNTISYVDGVAWSAIGARNAEDQNMRARASGLLEPVGIKNTTSGDIQPAVDAIVAARGRHSFVGIGADGIEQIQTDGNPHGHVILRGSNKGPNYSQQHVAHAAELLHSAGLPEAVIIDTSHGNSNKDHTRQPSVVAAVAEMVEAGGQAPVGVMIESHLHDGRQNLNPKKLAELKYGVSITDACINVSTTRAGVEGLAFAVHRRRNNHRTLIQ